MELDDLIYEEHEDFNQSIDDDEGVVTILSTSFRASKVLYTLEKETYRIALTDFENQQTEELKQLAFNVLPDCIGKFFAIFLRVSDENQNHIFRYKYDFI